MNRIFHLRGLVFFCLCVGLIACKPAADKKDEKSAEAHAGESTNAEAGLKIDAETQAKIGLKVEAVNESEFTPETKCFGHVIDPSPLNASINEIDLAQANLLVSQKELDRLKVLREQDNASERALQAAQAAFDRDRLAVQAATEKLQLAWGKELGSRKDLAALAKSFAAGERSLVRIDFPIDEKPATSPQRLRISLMSAQEAFDAELLGDAPTIDLPTQGKGLFFLVNAGNDKLPIGANVSSGVSAGSALKGFMIPTSAVVFHEGERWFYSQESGTNFHRESVLNSFNSASGYFVTNGVEAGEHIVTSGAQQLLSEELKSQIAPD